MSILEVNKIRPFSGDNVTISSLKNIQIQADLHVSGTVTAENFHTTTVTSSVLYQSGSTQMGNSADDAHIIVGGIYHTGQTEQTGFYYLTGDITQSGDYRLNGNKLHTGNLVQTGNLALTGTGSINGRVEHVGYSQHTGDFSISGSFTNTGGDVRLEGTNIDLFGDVTLDGSLTSTSGSDTNLQGALNVDGALTANGGFQLTGPFNYDEATEQIVAGNIWIHNSSYDAGGIKITGNANDLQLDSIGGDVVIGTNATRTTITGPTTLSGSNTLVGTTSIGSINSGETNLYGSIEYNAGTTHFRALNLINFESTPIFEVGLEVTGSLTVGAINDVSASIALNETNITNLETATSASDAALDTRVTTAESHISNLHAFTGSLDDTYATDAELSAVSGALASSINTSVAGLNAASSSYALTSNVSASDAVLTTNLLVATGSINVNETNIGLLTALTGSLVSTQTAYNIASGSYITSASIGDYVRKDLLKAIVTGSVDFDAFKTAILGL